MSKFFINKIALPIAIVLMSIGSANAALNCNVQPSCTELGYSTGDVEGCDSYVRCPFDTTYKACVKIAETEVPVDCTGFTYDVCPDTAMRCTACGTGTDVKYKITRCNIGYDLSGESCVASSCDGYNLSSCPATAENCLVCQSGTTQKYQIGLCKDGYSPIHLDDPVSGRFISNCAMNACADYTLSSCPKGGTCDTCKSGATTKYKLTGCSGGFAPNDGACYDCQTMSTKLKNATGQRGYYLFCDNADCKTTSTSCEAGLGWYDWNDPCICGLVGYANCKMSIDSTIDKPLIDGTISTNPCKKSNYDSCMRTKTALNSLVLKHNSLCTQATYQVKPHTNFSFNCSLYIPKDSIYSHFCQSYD